MKNLGTYFCIFLLISVSNCAQTWLKEVSGYNTSEVEGYAGIIGKPMTSLRVSGGEPYRVHILNGKWLPEVTGNDEGDSKNGYAGIDGQKIDGIAIKGTTYRVHILGGDWLDPVSKYDINDNKNGMAGILGKTIDAVMIKDRSYASAYIKEDTTNIPSQKEVVRCIKAQVGKPCVSGGDGPDTFDSSGLAYYCHDKKIPRKASDQAKSGTSVDKAELMAGDLMFWDINGDGTVTHTTIYIGDGKMIYAPGPGDSVKEAQSSSNYWDPKYVTARRYWT